MPSADATPSRAPSSSTWRANRVRASWERVSTRRRSDSRLRRASSCSDREHRGWTFAEEADEPLAGNDKRGDLLQSGDRRHTRCRIDRGDLAKGVAATAQGEQLLTAFRGRAHNGGSAIQQHVYVLIALPLRDQDLAAW